MSKIKKALTCVLSAVFALGMGGCNTPPSGADINPDYKPYDEALRVADTRELTDAEYSMFNTVATDDFGRKFFTVDGMNNEKYVGMFYFICQGQNKESTGIYDVNVITEEGKNHDAFAHTNNASSPVGAAHFWGEPVYGYYNSEDPWVARKHIELLTMAGVDFLCFDVSNALTYKNVTDMLFEIMQEYYDAGWNVPKFMYYTAHDSGAGQNKSTIKEVYDNYYKDGKYKDLWFCPYDDGKPLITRHRNSQYAAGDEIGEFFHFRYRQWPTEGFEEEGVPWIEFTYPQPIHDGWMNASVATHCKTVRLSDREANPGRGATWYGSGATASFVNDGVNWRQGAHLEQQWDNIIARKDEVDFAFVTGWNEWCATKFDGGDRYYTVDQYDPEYSRDIEPSRSAGIGDNFYLQTVRKIREYKSEEAKHYVYADTEIDVTKDDEKWNGVKTYLDFTADCSDRDFKLAIYGGDTRKHLINKTGRNDIESVKVAKDGEYLYFRITATENITAYEQGDTNWMNVWIKTANGAGDMLNGYNYVINRNVHNGKTDVMRTKSANNVKKCGEGDVSVFGKAMVIRVPLSALGLSSTDYTFEFKVTDNVNFDNDYMNLYDTGDCAPCGRFNFQFGY